MTEQRNALARLFVACWNDAELKARFAADPKAVMKAFDLKVPDGIEVKVVENTDRLVHITLPAPPKASGELSDDDLEDASGGFLVGTAM